MFITTHLAAGLLVGKMTGNYPLAIGGAIIWDIDHLIPYYRHHVLKSPAKFWHAITSGTDPYRGQRGWFHNIFAWLLIAGASLLLLPPPLGVAFSLGYLSHLVLDAFDTADFWPLYPSKAINLHGPIRYFSLSEASFAFALLLLFALV